MFCTQCGKKLKDTMLFCPNCGSPIELPDDDEEIVAESAFAAAAVQAPSRETPKPEPVDIPEISEDKLPDEQTVIVHEQESETAFDVNEPEIEQAQYEKPQEDISQEDVPEIEEVSIPLLIDEPEEEAPAWEKIDPQVRRRPPDISRDRDSVDLSGHAPRMKGRSEHAAKPVNRKGNGKQPAARAARTYVPAKVPHPDDMFMDADPFDDFDEDEYMDLPDDDFEYEDDDVESSFFFRHIRGIMGFSLLGLLAVICMMYMFSETGQVALARMNLAWRPEVYSKVAYTYYENGMYDMSGSYYEKALARDTDNYNYAISAASAYIYGEETEKAAGMLKKCINIDPARAEPYIYLMNIYPDPASRPWDVSQLLQQGYGRTGDDRLKAVAQ